MELSFIPAGAEVMTVAPSSSAAKTTRSVPASQAGRIWELATTFRSIGPEALSGTFCSAPIGCTHARVCRPVSTGCACPKYMTCVPSGEGTGMAKGPVVDVTLRSGRSGVDEVSVRSPTSMTQISEQLSTSRAACRAHTNRSCLPSGVHAGSVWSKSPCVNWITAD